MHTCIHIQVHVHTDTHVHMRAYAHTSVRTHTCTYVHTCVHAHICTHTFQGAIKEHFYNATEMVSKYGKPDYIFVTMTHNLS